MEKINQLLERLKNVKSHSTDLNSQIEFFEILSEMFKSPITIAILNSLKELRGIKNKSSL